MSNEEINVIIHAVTHTHIHSHIPNNNNNDDDNGSRSVFILKVRVIFPSGTSSKRKPVIEFSFIHSSCMLGLYTLPSSSR